MCTGLGSGRSSAPEVLRLLCMVAESIFLGKGWGGGEKQNTGSRKEQKQLVEAGRLRKSKQEGVVL